MGTHPIFFLFENLVVLVQTPEDELYYTKKKMLSSNCTNDLSSIIFFCVSDTTLMLSIVRLSLCVTFFF